MTIPKDDLLIDPEQIAWNKECIAFLEQFEEKDRPFTDAQLERLKRFTNFLEKSHKRGYKRLSEVIDDLKIIQMYSRRISLYGDDNKLRKYL